MLKTYTVVITEKLEQEVDVKAVSKDEALEKVQKKYKKGKIVLDSSDFVETTFDIYERT